ncbi:MAG: DUF4864 domain-containing protein [Rhizobacter sp.]|nr:DUF4864 domain-containing protein [Rhizobacter sp.]MBP6268644.1 DUF4864 domain-containing protein [Rhizobacter sp.]
MNAALIQRRALITLSLGLATGVAWPAEVPEAQAAKAREVVQAQLDAFAADDARRAFLLASPSARRHLRSPDNFINLVRRNYAVVYRPASVAFLKPQLIDGVVILGVQMTDAQGSAWLATYQLERQPDGIFLIDGCELVANEGRYT